MQCNESYQKLNKYSKKRKHDDLESDERMLKIPCTPYIPRTKSSVEISKTKIKDAPDYNMLHRKRGKAIIFNHYLCFGHEKPRHGTELDVSRLGETLTSILNFEVRIYNDLRYQQIMDVLLNLSKNSFTREDCVAIFVLTHGTRYTLTAVDQKYPIEDLWRNFSPWRCPTLAGKPKLFFINACRGKQVDEGFMYQNMRDGPELDNELFRAPIYADVLVFFSTMEGFTATRDILEGSWFIQSLCEVLEDKKYRRMELKEILTLTTRKTALMCNKLAGRITQMPTIMSTLLRNIYFFSKESAIL